jgi:hypothetical protein
VYVRERERERVDKVERVERKEEGEREIKRERDKRETDRDEVIREKNKEKQKRERLPYLLPKRMCDRTRSAQIVSRFWESKTVVMTSSCT